MRPCGVWAFSFRLCLTLLADTLGVRAVGELVDGLGQGRPRPARCRAGCRPHCARLPTRAPSLPCAVCARSLGHRAGASRPIGTVGAMTRLSPGDPAPTVHPARRGRQRGLAGRLPRPQGGRVLLPGRDDPGLHDAGLRLPRQPRLAGLRRLRGRSASRPTSRRSWRSSATATRVTFPLLSDARSETLEAYGAFGEKTMYGKKVTGVIRSTFVVDEDGKRRARAVQRQGHRPRGQAAPRPRGSTAEPTAAGGAGRGRRTCRGPAGRAGRRAALGVVDDRRRRARPRGRDDRLRARAGAGPARPGDRARGRARRRRWRERPTAPTECA